jgi:putative phage-type endonuclease
MLNVFACTRRRQQVSQPDAIANIMKGVVHVFSSCAPPPNTDEWLNWRRYRLTASDCPKVIGRAFKSRERLLREKKGLQEPWQGNGFTRAGHDFEGSAIASYERFKGVKVFTDLPPVVHPYFPGLAASLDGITASGVNVEIKCLSDAKIHVKPKPVHFYQVQFQMACSMLEKTHLVYYYLKLNEQSEVCDNIRGERAMKVFEIDFDPLWFEEHLPSFKAFVNELYEEPCALRLGADLSVPNQ